MGHLNAQTCVKTLETLKCQLLGGILCSQPHMLLCDCLCGRELQEWALGTLGPGCHQQGHRPQQLHMVRGAGMATEPGDSHGPAVILTQLFSQELIQGRHHLRAGQSQTLQQREKTAEQIGVLGGNSLWIQMMTSQNFSNED